METIVFAMFPVPMVNFFVVIFFRLGGLFSVDRRAKRTLDFTLPLSISALLLVSSMLCLYQYSCTHCKCCFCICGCGACCASHSFIFLCAYACLACCFATGCGCLISGLALILDVLLHASLELLAPVKPGLDTRMSSMCWPSWRKSWSWRSLAEAQPSLALSSSASLEGEIARSLSQGSRRTTN